MEEQILLTVFTDPMMGLSYESEPIMDALARRYGERLAIRYVMSVLVRDVSDFMTSAERALPPEQGILLYCKRLAQIYKSEESIGGLPINMEDFRLFDPEHRSSMPLCLAYKAAQIVSPDKAETFLLRLRHATVQDCRPTTHEEEILAVVRKSGIDEQAFLAAYRDGRGEAALERDFTLTRSMGIHSLPTYLLQCRDKGVLLQSFDMNDFLTAIARITQN